ncbi:gas vesicle protein GvpO [Thermocrispum agreste]|uniref:gas vesicle protein GvpO n=1 Tax=Thermocrispum agreste TaxID=37925 RepID=UPI0004129D19|nr:gas vesicle protein GvpO [Thermocrispum agreste]
MRSDDDGGWSVLVDVVELERIPSSTDVLATYRVDITSTGDLAGYERLRRYHRGATDPT